MAVVDSPRLHVVRSSFFDNFHRSAVVPVVCECGNMNVNIHTIYKDGHILYMCIYVYKLHQAIHW